MIPVSVVVMTKNEERNIASALASVKDFDEVFVVDSASTDCTRKIATRLRAKVVDFTGNGGYPKKKQWCLENVPFSHDWVLYLDADEVVTPVLASEIAAILTRDFSELGFLIALDYVFLGRKLRYGHRVYKLALINRHCSRFIDYDDLDASNMWEVEGHYQPHVEGKVGRLRGRIEHRDHDDLFHFFDRHNKYSDWEAVLRTKGVLSSREESQGAGRGLVKRAFRRMPFQGAAFFVYGYVGRLGFLDGRPGLHYALAKSFYYWQTGIKAQEFKAHGILR
jgi:glycosyltransferase involved in cell wall biosynthesis